MSINNIYSTTSKAKPGILFGIGNPLLDISAETPEDFLKKYELDADSQILADENKHKNLYTDMIENFTVDYLPGGATQNTIRAFQWALQNLEEAKGASIFTGCVGEDNYKNSLEKSAEKAGVKTKYAINKKGLPTGTCAVVITKSGKNRSLVANLAAANVYQESDINDVWEEVKNASYFYSAGFFITTEGGPKALEKIGQHCIDNEKCYITNLSAPFLSMFFKDQLTLSLSYSDIIFCNESEAAVWAENFGFESIKGDLKQIAQEMANFQSKKDLKKRPRLVVITQGCDPTIVCQNGQVEEYNIIKLDDSKIVDTNGAGDAFVAGFLTGLVYGKKVEKCVELGNYVASTIIQMPGCTFPSESKLEIE